MTWSSFHSVSHLAQDVSRRIESAIRFQEGDRVPVWDYVDSPDLLERLDRTLPGASAEEKGAALVKALGIDVCWGFGGLDTLSWRTRGGAEQGTNADDLHGFSDKELWRHFLHHPRLASTNWIRDTWVPWVRHVQNLLAPRTLFVPAYGSGFYEAVQLLGQEPFWYAISDHPGDLARLLEVEGETAMRFATVAAQSRVSPIYFLQDDIAGGTGLLYSPGFLRKHFLPGLRRCVEILKSAGITVIFHSDGKLLDLVDDLLDAGIDGLHPLEPLCGMNLAMMKRRYGKHLVLVGGVDATLLLPLKSQSEVCAAVRDALRQAGPGGGYFIGSSGEMMPYVPPENVLGFYAACHEYGNYPIPTAESDSLLHAPPAPPT